METVAQFVWQPFLRPPADAAALIVVPTHRPFTHCEHQVDSWLGDRAGQQGFGPGAVISQRGTGGWRMQAKLTEVELTFNHAGLSCMMVQLASGKSEKLTFHTTLAFCES